MQADIGKQRRNHRTHRLDGTGTGTFTPPDSQPCRLLPPVYASPCISQCTVQDSEPSGSLFLSRKALASSSRVRAMAVMALGATGRVRSRRYGAQIASASY